MLDNAYRKKESNDVGRPCICKCEEPACNYTLSVLVQAARAEAGSQRNIQVAGHFQHRTVSAVAGELTLHDCTQGKHSGGTA